MNHCINDILVQGAQPLFFLDYVAASRLDPVQIATIVEGVARACREAECALLGGETAEMPGVYEPGAIDLVGTIVGVVERDRLIDGRHIRPGDAIMALPSSGLHTNGYTLARSVLKDMVWDEPLEPLDGQTLAETLLAPHKAYLKPVQKLWRAGVEIRGMVHITGGGLIDNPPRIFPEGVGAVIERSRWTVPPIFDLLQQKGMIADNEMFQVFNMGLGMLLIIPAEQRDPALKALSGELIDVGEIVAGNRTVRIVGE